MDLLNSIAEKTWLVNLTLWIGFVVPIYISILKNDYYWSGLKVNDLLAAYATRFVHLKIHVWLHHRALIGTFRSEDEDDYEYEFSVLSTRTSKNVGLQTFMHMLSTQNSYS